MLKNPEREFAVYLDERYTYGEAYAEAAALAVALRDGAGDCFLDDDLRLRDVAFFFAKGSLHRQADGDAFEVAEYGRPGIPDDHFSLCSLPE